MTRLFRQPTATAQCDNLTMKPSVGETVTCPLCNRLGEVVQVSGSMSGHVDFYDVEHPREPGPVPVRCHIDLYGTESESELNEQVRDPFMPDH